MHTQYTKLLLYFYVLSSGIKIMDFVKSREDFISQFLNHLGTSAMMDLLLQMVAAPENDQNRIDLAEVRSLHSPTCLLYTSPSPRDATLSRMPSSA